MCGAPWLIRRAVPLGEDGMEGKDEQGGEQGEEVAELEEGEIISLAATPLGDGVGWMPAKVPGTCVDSIPRFS